MRIAIYSHSVPPSVDGVARRFTGLIRELQAQGHEVLLFTLETHPQGISGCRFFTFAHTFLSVYRSKKVGNPTPWNFFKALLVLWRERPDVLHVTTDPLSYFFGLAAALVGVPAVASIHTDLQEILKAVGGNALMAWSARNKEMVDSMAFASLATTSFSFRDKLRTWDVLCDHVIHTAVDVINFTPSKRSEELRAKLTFGNPDAFIAIYAGRLSPEKRVDVMVDVVQRMENTYLVIVGDGPLAQELEQLHGPEKRVYCQPAFLSHAELADMYASSDVHVSASLFETLGNTVLEAQACAIPVVVPEAQGFCDTVRNRVDGFLYDPQDADSAQAYLEELRDDPQLREALGEAGREKVLRQTVQYVVQDLVEWYSQSIEKHRARSAWEHFVCVFHFTWAMCLEIFMVQTWETAAWVLILLWRSLAALIVSCRQKIAFLLRPAKQRPRTGSGSGSNSGSGGGHTVGGGGSTENGFGDHHHHIHEDDLNGIALPGDKTV